MNDINSNNIHLKVNLYIISLSLLFIFFIIITANVPVYCGKDWEFIGLINLLKLNVIPFICFSLLIYSVFAYWHFIHVLKGSTDIPFEIKKIKSINYEHLTFLATYVIPLISFDFNNLRQLSVLTILLIIMGAIYIKTDLFYANPSLALMGFHIYEADGHFKTGNRENIILLCRNRLQSGNKVKYIKLDDRIYFVKEV